MENIFNNPAKYINLLEKIQFIDVKNNLEFPNKFPNKQKSTSNEVLFCRFKH